MDMQKRNLTLGLALVGVIGAVAIAAEAMDDMAAEDQAGTVPMFEVDPFWPKPLPNHWLIGPTIGIEVDGNDGVWIVQRNTLNQFVLNTEVGMVTDTSYYNDNAPPLRNGTPLSECCQPGPPIMHFDPEGNLLHAWGGPGTETGDYTWPESNHGITIDGQGNVWMGGNGGPDRQVLKFTQDGRFLAEYGESGSQNSSTSRENFGRVAALQYVEQGNEIFLADGYLNRRVAVLDAATGAVKRFWGARGNVPSDAAVPGYQPGETPPNQFRTPVHCAERANDGLVYVCDRPSNRLSVFRTDGTFVRETIIAPATLSQGSTWEVAFSPDAQQRFMYLADGQNMKVYVMDRQSLEILYSFGDGGRQPGLFFAVHSIATDSQGNIFTTETYEGSRLQKFRYTGMGARPSQRDTGPAWPQARKSGGYGWSFGN
jgi:DNA-binding beta-propeller fold protein YncE